MAHGRAAWVSLVGFLVFALIAPVPVWSASLSMGSARGVRAVELSLDDGKNWLPLGSRSLPILDGTQLRTTNGGAVVDLNDGSRVNVMPFSSLRFRDASGTTEVSLVHGRLSFRLPRETRVEISGPTVRLEPVRAEVMQGEFFVAREGTAGLKMTAGSLEVHELAGAQQVRLASLEPVFLPGRPATAAPLFISEAPVGAPPGARAVFDPKGESLGYLRPDAQLVVQPGYTADLTRPFSPKLIQLAMARIDERNRPDAMPVFDVNGGYVGYLAGPVFHAQGQLAQGQLAQGQLAQAQIAQAVAGTPAGGPSTFLGMNSTAFFALGGSLLAVGGVTAAGASGAFKAATPLGPKQ
jgi:hypothetical protein